MKRKVASRKYPFCEKCRSSEGQEGVFPWEVSCFSSKMKDFLRESSWNVEVMHFLLFSPVLLVSTLRFMTAYVTPGQPANLCPQRHLNSVRELLIESQCTKHRHC